VLLTSQFKYYLYRLHLAKWANRLLFYFSKWKNKNNNLAYRRKHPDQMIPPDHFLHETFQLDYRLFFEQGKLAATEIIQWTGKYCKNNSPAILDWGCGMARITQHLPAEQPYASIYGCDINTQMIEWDKTHYPGISFVPLLPFTPSPFADDFFDLIIGFSVLTHIDADEQENWLSELNRIVKPGGIVCLTTHGEKYFTQLTAKEKRKLQKNGIYTRTYQQPGQRMMTSYHEPAAFKKIISTYFSILEYHSGLLNPSKTGGQDLWILQKV
jgi:SAM-dependent methyltransferase